MSTRLRFASAAAFLFCLIAVSAYAQEPSAPAPAPAPANLAFVDGSVDVVQGGVSEPAEPPFMLLDGDVVRTRNGRAEIVFRDGTLLHLSHDSDVELLGDERVRLTSGRVIVRLSHAAARPYVIDTPAASVRLEASGEYEVTSSPAGQLKVAVSRGAATLQDTSPWSIRGGQMLTVLGPGGRPLIEPFNSARWDAFATWSQDRANGLSTAASAQQLPYELRPYGPVLDRYGRWDYVEPHGYVWFPSVGATWRPYYDGAWSFTRYGWTWHGRDRWAWPTHHYGRWGFTGSFWYWVPATVWAPAWVTWSVASGYVSWAPLGWHTPRHLDVWGRRDHPAYDPYYSPWRGWTVLPRHQFAPRRNVRAYAVDGDRLNDAARDALLSNATPVRTDDVAVPRGSVEMPGARGGYVRRPVPRAPGAAPADQPSRADAPRSGERRDAPEYRAPSAWSGAAAARTRERGGERQAGEAGGRDAGSGAVERAGRVRDPGNAGGRSDGGKSGTSAQGRSSAGRAAGDAAGGGARSGATRRPKG